MCLEEAAEGDAGEADVDQTGLARVALAAGDVGLALAVEEVRQAKRCPMC